MATFHYMFYQQLVQPAHPPPLSSGTWGVILSITWEPLLVDSTVKP